MTMNEIIDTLLTCDELEFAEIFVKYWKTLNTNGGLARADEVDLTADDMNNFPIGAFLNHMGTFLGEVIFSEEIESSAWWKGEMK